MRTRFRQMDEDSAPAMPHTGGGFLMRRAQLMRSRAAWWFQQMRRKVDEATSVAANAPAAPEISGESVNMSGITHDKLVRDANTAGASNSSAEAPSSRSLDEAPAPSTNQKEPNQ